MPAHQDDIPEGTQESWLQTYPPPAEMSDGMSFSKYILYSNNLEGQCPAISLCTFSSSALDGFLFDMKGLFDLNNVTVTKLFRKGIRFLPNINRNINIIVFIVFTEILIMTVHVLWHYVVV